MVVEQGKQVKFVAHVRQVQDRDINTVESLGFWALATRHIYLWFGPFTSHRWSEILITPKVVTLTEYCQSGRRFLVRIMRGALDVSALKFR